MGFRTTFTPSDSLKPMNIPVSRFTLLLLITLIAAPWGFLCYVLFSNVRQHSLAPVAERKSEPNSPPIADGNHRIVRQGAWGTLVISPLTISPPLEFVSSLDVQTIDNDWHFPRMQRADVESKLASVPLKTSLHEELLAAIEADPAHQGFKIPRRENFVRRLSPEARAGLYGILSEWSENPAQINAFRFCSKSAEEWLENSNLSEETLAAMRPLMYRNGHFTLFADILSVRPVAIRNQELDQLHKVLSRERTLLVKLQVDETTDIEPLVEYWGSGGRQKDVRPLLESLKQKPGGGTIDITHLLPPFARRRVYTYIDPTSSRHAIAQDCHWTALNFFGDGSIAESATSAQKLELMESEYYPHQLKDGELRMGDLVHYVDQADDIYHSAVYIAGDILFTRNGTRSARPWMFLFREEMKDYYLKSGNIRVVYTRAKPS